MVTKFSADARARVSSFNAEFKKLEREKKKLSHDRRSKMKIESRRFLFFFLPVFFVFSLVFLCCAEKILSGKRIR